MSDQIEWTDAPTAASKLPACELRRCPPGGLKPQIILSDWITGNELHWFNGRSFPHLKNDCPACAAKRAKVWKGYLAALDPAKRTVYLLEITPNCVDAATAYKQSYGSLRGSALTLNRSATKANGRVTASFVPANLAGLDLPQPPDVRGTLERMWQTDHRKADSKPEDPRIVLDGPKDNEANERVNRSRFTTEGSPTSKVYETTAEQRRMLAANARTNGNGKHHADAK